MNLLVMQSGGPTASLNATLAGILNNAKNDKNINKVYGSLYGITGLIKDNIIELNLFDHEINKLKTTPSAYLGSARYILSETYLDAKYNIINEYDAILKNINKYHIDGILIIGGNDSMDTVLKLNKFFKALNINCKILGVPKTIDNDLVLTDHTPGYGNAIKYIANTISNIKLDTTCYENNRITIVEVMGRDAGWLTAGSKLASLNNLGPDLIYLPEVKFDIEKMLKDVEAIYQKNKSCLIVVSEGLKNKEGEYLLNSFSYNQINDVFNHPQLGGVSIVLANIIKSRLDIPVRNIILNVMQRCAGEDLSLTDINESFEIGRFAVSKITSSTGKVISIRRLSTLPYVVDFELIDVKKVANKVKYFPSEWIINNNDISKEFLIYAEPLIKGNINTLTSDGLHSYLLRK